MLQPVQVQPHRRAASRHAVDFECTVLSEVYGEPIPFRVKDMSADGLFALSDLLLDPGDEVLIELTPPRVGEPLCILGHVSRTEVEPAEGFEPGMGIAFDHTASPLDAWITLMFMEVWHWTPLVVLLAYAGLRAIPDAYYQAASIDGASAWAVFRYIQLPKMRGVLTIAVLLRFMDSFLIYAEPFVLTGGGPGNSTTFLSIYLVKIAVGQFDLGPAAAFSLIYFLIILLFSWLFYQAIQNVGKGDAP